MFICLASAFVLILVSWFVHPKTEITNFEWVVGFWLCSFTGPLCMLIMFWINVYDSKQTRDIFGDLDRAARKRYEEPLKRMPK